MREREREREARSSFKSEISISKLRYNTFIIYLFIYLLGAKSVLLCYMTTPLQIDFFTCYQKKKN